MQSGGAQPEDGQLEREPSQRPHRIEQELHVADPRVDEPADSAGARTPSLEDRAAVEQAVRRGHEREDTPQEPRGAEEADRVVPGVRFLASVMQATFFTDLFVYHADRFYVHATAQERHQAMKAAHPRFYNWCRNADYAARAVLMTITVALVTTACFLTLMKLLG